jgi:hypothetical protein
VPHACAPRDLPPECALSLFTHPAYLGANGIRAIVQIDRRHTAAGAALPGPALFSDRGNALHYLGRLDRLELSEAQRVSAELLQEHDAGFVVFEDIELVRDHRSNNLSCLEFRYHGNWRLSIAGELPMSGTRRRQMRKLARRLVEFSGHDMSFRFERAKNDDIDRIIELNREKISHVGRTHHFSDDKRRALKAVCAEIGYQALLSSGDDLVAGDILCVTGPRSYVMVSGYDLQYERFSPGLHTYHYAMTQLQALGCSEANYLWGDNPMKARLGAERRQLSTLVIARNRRALLSPGFWKECSAFAVPAVKDAIKRKVLRRQT